MILVELVLEVADCSIGRSSRKPLVPAKMIAICFPNVQRLELRLLQHFGQPLTAIELRLRRFVEVGAELRERREFAILREVELQSPATCLMALICAEPPTRVTESPTFTAGRTPELNRSVSRKI